MPETLTPREKINTLATRDATVLTYISYGNREGETWTETMEKLVLALAAEKVSYYNQATRATALNGKGGHTIPPNIFAYPTDQNQAAALIERLQLEFDL